MACDLRCPECGDNFGKDTENSVMTFCGDCRIYIYNERGEVDPNDEKEKEFIRKHKAQAQKRIAGFERRIGWRR